MKIMQILGYALMAGLLSGPVQAQSRILCLGDSITQGHTPQNSYRRALWHRLASAGASIDFIGSLNSNLGGSPPNPDFDLDHEGHWGWRADEVLAGLPAWLVNYTPDVVLLHLGSNDAFQNDGGANFVAQTSADLRAIIRALQNDNPQVIVLLARLIPTLDSARNVRISALNGQIDTIASTTTTSTSRVVVVDQSSGFNASTDTTDGIHPNNSGESKMANKWFDAMNALGLLPTSPSVTAFANGSFEAGYTRWAAFGNQGIGTSGSPYVSTDGAKLVVFNWGETPPNGVLSQTFATTVGQTYALTFSAGVIAYNRSEQRLDIAVLGNGTLLARTVTLTGTPDGVSRWSGQGFSFTANTPTTTLRFQDSSSTSQAIDLLLDNVRLEMATPPPIGGSEATNLSFESGYAGWNVTGNQGVVASGSPYAASDGSKLVVFNWGQTLPNGTLAQSFTTVAGRTYRLVFSAGIIAYNRDEQRLQISVQGNGTLLAHTLSFFGDATGVTRLSPHRFSFTADSANTTLTFRDVSPATHNLDLLLDGIRIEVESASVPPPLASNLSFESGYAGWTVTGNQGVGSSGASYTASEGTRLVVFNWGQTLPNGTLSQTFATVPGKGYSLALDVGVVAFNQNEQKLEVKVQGNGLLLNQMISLFGLANGATKYFS